MCQRNLDRICEKAERLGNVPVWIDMENSPYVDPTLTLYRASKAKYKGVGIAIQAYLYRTAQDIESLIPLGPAIRIVKGAYLEPPDVAYPKKSDVDENFYTLCVRLMAEDAQKAGTLLHIATHDIALADRLSAYIDDEQGAVVRLRVRDALRHPAEPAAAAGAERTPHPRPHQLRRVLVPVVHAPAGRAPGQRHVRVEEPEVDRR